MKKIFMGLTALSTLSFAAINLGTATPDTNVWEAGSKGKIDVEGFVTSTVPIIKYVVYSSANGDYDSNGDKWNLNDIVVAQNEQDSAMSEAPKKVYVKRVNSGNSGVEPLGIEKISFTLNRDPYYTKVPSEIPLGTAGLEVQPLSILSKTTLETIITDAGITASVSQSGDIETVDKIYRTFKSFKFINSENGILEVKYENTRVFNEHPMSPEMASKVETALATKRAISNLSISVTVN